MPIYEFYCPKCHTIYSFLSRSIDTDGTPGCPRHARHPLQRQVSRFAVVSGGAAAHKDDADDLPVDEAKMEQAMSTLASEADSVDEDDPRAAARLMRRLSDMTGIEYGHSMQEALRRLEGGEDPEAIEAEMGDLLENDEDSFLMPGASKGRRGLRRLPPRRDDHLYEM
jgi:putative FmdB family regulatory protein